MKQAITYLTLAATLAMPTLSYSQDCERSCEIPESKVIGEHRDTRSEICLDVHPPICPGDKPGFLQELTHDLTAMVHNEGKVIGGAYDPCSITIHPNPCEKEEQSDPKAKNEEDERDNYR